MPTALQVGTDHALLHSRARILNLAGLQAVTSCLVSRWSTEFMTGPFDLVLLCHSLPKAEQESITANVHSWNPDTMVVLIGRDLNRLEGGVDAVLSCAPERLVKDLPLLLTNRPAASAKAQASC